MPTPDASADAEQLRRHARWALVVLTLINLFNYIDRYVMSTLFDSLKAPSALGLNDGQIGWLTTGFLAVYALTSPVFGKLGDRGGRSRLIASGVAIWSVGTVAGGFARGFLSLFAGRATVGVGEAAYGSIAPSILSDHYPKARRARVLGIFYAAIPIGAALGYILGSTIRDAWGWRAAFFIAGAPGLVLALLLARMKDPERGAQDDPADLAALVHGSGGGGGWRTYLDLLRNGPYMGTVLGYAAYTFGMGAISMWMPTFLTRVRGLHGGERQFGLIVVATGLIGTWAGGWIGDAMLKRSPRAYLQLATVTTLLAAPIAWVALTNEHRVIYTIALTVAMLLLFASTGPVNTAIINAVVPELRATAMAFSILLIHFLGDVPSPLIVGTLSRNNGDNAASLAGAVLIVPPAILVGGLIWLVAALWPSRAQPATAG